MNVNEYSCKLDQLEAESVENMTALGQWAQAEALPWLWSELGGVVLTPKPKHPSARVAPAQPTLKPMGGPEAVRHGLIISESDRTTKSSSPSFYQAQLTMLDAEATRYCSSIATFASTTNPFAVDAVVHTLQRALLEMLHLARVLLEDAAREVAEVPGYFGAWRRKRELPFEVFKGAEQIIYGTYSGMTHVDRAPYIPVAVLRTALELRIRHAFGVYSMVDLSNPYETRPIDMNRLFMAITARHNEIDFAVDLHDVWKIYRWSNFYLHGGARDFPWVPGFLLQYLRPLFADPRTEPDGSWNMDGGIRMRRATWQAVRESLQPLAEDRSLPARIGNAWRALFPAKRRAMELPAFDQGAAQCVFLD